MEIRPREMLDLMNWFETEETEEAVSVCIKAFPRCTREQDCELAAEYFTLLKIDGKVELSKQERRQKNELGRVCGACDTCARKVRGLAAQFGW